MVGTSCWSLAAADKVDIFEIIDSEFSVETDADADGSYDKLDTLPESFYDYFVIQGNS